MAQSDARFGYRADMKRDDHDLSQRLGFTTSTGMLSPIWFDFATPGDAYYMQHDMPLLRSQNLAAPAMIDVKVHFETFFVPLQMIYQPSENTLFSLKNLQSNMYNQANLRNNSFPLFDYGGFITAVTNSQGSWYTTDVRADAFRLADLMGLCPDNFTDVNYTNQHQTAYAFFPWQLLAYHTIFQYYYRLDDKTNFDNTCCNWDSNYGSAQPGGSALINMMSIHQRPWDFDYYTSIYRSPIVSVENMQQVLPGSSNYSQLSNAYIRGIDSNGNAQGNSLVTQFSAKAANAYSDVNVNMSLATATIRQMFANEKLAMITGRTRKNYDSQVLAHYGVRVPHDVKHDITMIHHDTYELNVQEVTSLAGTSDATLGELAGKSYAAGNGKKFKFVAPCHGVIMTIFSVEPKRRYIGGFDKLNMVADSFDLPTPEFDRLGNQPMFRYEIGYHTSLTSGNPSDSDIIGWKERYYQFKRKHDKATIAFDIFGQGSNAYSAYMLASRPLTSSIVYNVQNPAISDAYYIPRNAFDNVCLMPFVFGWKLATSESSEDWSKTPWLVYARDPFIINSFIKCKKVSWMSKDGEPIYNF